MKHSDMSEVLYLLHQLESIIRLLEKDASPLSGHTGTLQVTHIGASVLRYGLMLAASEVTRQDLQSLRTKRN